MDKRYLDNVMTSGEAAMHAINQKKFGKTFYHLGPARDISVFEKVKDNMIEVGDGKLSRNVTKSKGALKKEVIYKALNKLTKNDVKAKEMTTYILDSRPDVQKIKLKMV